MNKLILFSTFLILIVLVFPALSYAIETGNMSVYPAIYDPNVPSSRAWYQLKLDPEKTYAAEITIVNKSDIKRTFSLYATDATTTSDGIFTLSQKGVVNDLGGWITLSNNEVTLEAKQQKNVPFKITVPASAQPGDHAAGIVVEETLPQNPEGVSIVSRIGVRVYLSVSGQEHENLNISNIGFDNMLSAKKINITLSNDGNVNEKIKTDYMVLSLNGFKNFSVNKDRVVFAGKKILLSDELNAALPMFARVVVSYGKDLNKSQSSVIVSQTAFILPLITIVGIFLFFIKKKKN